MSDMSRPALPPSASAHDQHEPLLVAQVVAGDPLDPATADPVRRWLRTCPQCAALAADLTRVSAAVAGEPVPPRRRDFRLSPEDAERLRGNAVTRRLRRLSWPRSRAFAPAAAGVMSIGLVFVVVGYAWPDGGAGSIETHSDRAPLTRTMEAAPASSAAVDAFDSEAMDASVMAEPAPADRAASGLAQKASSAEADDVTRDTAGVGEASRAEEAPEAGALEANRSVDVAEQIDGSEALPAEPELASPAGSAPVTESGSEAEWQRWLVLAGVLLATGGGALLLLAWLSRRSRDPLLP